jgi:hypothetical protein
MGEVVKFVEDLQSLRGLQKRVIKHAIDFTRIYGHKLTRMQLIFATGAGLLVCAQRLTTSLSGFGWARRPNRPRTFISSTEPLDHMYTPAFRVDSRFESHFRPTMVTDKRGELHQDILDSGLLKERVSANVAKAV